MTYSADVDGDAIIVLTEAARSYRPSRNQTVHALRGVSLRVASGDFVAVLGKSGSGKSTLLNLVAGLDRPTAGEVKVAGEQLRHLSEAGLALWRGRNLGVVFQFFQLLPTLTTEENVLI